MGDCWPWMRWHRRNRSADTLLLWQPVVLGQAMVQSVSALGTAQPDHWYGRRGRPDGKVRGRAWPPEGRSSGRLRNSTGTRARRRGNRSRLRFLTPGGVPGPARRTLGSPSRACRPVPSASSGAGGPQGAPVDAAGDRGGFVLGRAGGRGGAALVVADGGGALGCAHQTSRSLRELVNARRSRRRCDRCLRTSASSTFDCDGDACPRVCVLAVPIASAISGRAGHCRRAADAGGESPSVRAARPRAGRPPDFPTFRFDYRGMGDSAGDARTFEHIRTDLFAALDVFQREEAVARVVLWGLCDGASAAWDGGAADEPRVAGIVALNPWARSRRARPPPSAALLSAASCRPGVLAQVAERSDSRCDNAPLSWRARSRAPPRHRLTLAATDYLQRMEDGWRRFSAPILVVLSGNDYTAREFEGWVGAAAARKALFAHGITSGPHAGSGSHVFQSGVAGPSERSDHRVDKERRLGSGLGSTHRAGDGAPTGTKSGECYDVTNRHVKTWPQNRV